MTKETKQLARTQALLRDLSGLMDAIEHQQARGFTGVVPLPLGALAHGVKHEIDRVLYPLVEEEK